MVSSKGDFAQSAGQQETTLCVPIPAVALLEQFKTSGRRVVATPDTPVTLPPGRANPGHNPQPQPWISLR
jgi:hypothetical protein